MAVSVLWPIFAVLWVGMQFVIVVFPDHAHVLFTKIRQVLEQDIYFEASMVIQWYGLIHET